MPPHPSVRHGRVSPRYARGLAAALVAVAALIAAAHVNPVRASEPLPAVGESAAPAHAWTVLPPTLAR
ncbi:hypothetical protein CP978_17885 [Streptomyces nodosus]|uniref:Uncharacterized protein n=1 Tax=Streptomyces nodosus TaxID=40318 RepID=A0A5P2W426_9ACTN|nr:hypothetical protein [Streptomyces nodosus]MYV48696.1 hypothetical protein [Streptomyces sp. SID2888]QEV40165.1 hypothetical protein CP978_17885 [Streptomyces nodosus]